MEKESRSQSGYNTSLIIQEQEQDEVRLNQTETPMLEEQKSSSLVENTLIPNGDNSKLSGNHTATPISKGDNSRESSSSGDNQTTSISNGNSKQKSSSSCHNQTSDTNQNQITSIPNENTNQKSSSSSESQTTSICDEAIDKKNTSLNENEIKGANENHITTILYGDNNPKSSSPHMNQTQTLTLTITLDINQMDIGDTNSRSSSPRENQTPADTNRNPITLIHNGNSNQNRSRYIAYNQNQTIPIRSHQNQSGYIANYNQNQTIPIRNRRNQSGYIANYNPNPNEIIPIPNGIGYPNQLGYVTYNQNQTMHIPSHPQIQTPPQILPYNYNPLYNNNNFTSWCYVPSQQRPRPQVRPQRDMMMSTHPSPFPVVNNPRSSYPPQPRNPPVPSPLYVRILKQIEYYFCDDNLAKEIYMKEQMDEQGWIPIAEIARFPKVLEITYNVVNTPLVLNALRFSEEVEIQAGNRRIRKRIGWEKYVLPNLIMRS